MSIGGLLAPRYEVQAVVWTTRDLATQARTARTARGSQREWCCFGLSGGVAGIFRATARYRVVLGRLRVGIDISLVRV
jgi:hypothetical protein